MRPEESGGEGGGVGFEPCSGRASNGETGARQLQLKRNRRAIGVVPVLSRALLYTSPTISVITIVCAARRRVPWSVSRGPGYGSRQSRDKFSSPTREGMRENAKRSIAIFKQLVGK